MVVDTLFACFVVPNVLTLSLDALQRCYERSTQNDFFTLT